MSLFDDFDSIETTELPKDNLRLTLSQRKKQFRKIKQTSDALSHLLPLPKKEEAVYMVSNARFDFYDFIPALIQIKNKKVTHLIGSTWIINRTNICGLFELFDSNKIAKIDFLTGIYFKRRESSNYATFVEGMQERGQRLKAALNHSKFFCLQFEDGECYTMQSSANFTENGNIETHVLENSADLFEFHKDWINEILK